MFASAQFSLYSVKYFKTFLQVFPADMLKITTFLFWPSPVVLGFDLSPVFRESGAILSWFCACQASDSATWRMAQQTLRNTNGSRTAGSIENHEPPPPFFLRMFFWTCFDDPFLFWCLALTLSLSLGANIFVQDPMLRAHFAPQDLSWDDLVAKKIEAPFKSLGEKLVYAKFSPGLPGGHPQREGC